MEEALIMDLLFEATPWMRMARRTARMWNQIVFQPTAARYASNGVASGVRVVDLE
jgi:hypothetical protein